MKNGPYTITSSKTIYKNPWIKVQEDKVIRPNGQEGIFGTVDNGSGVSVVALDKDNNIYLIKEFYYVLGQYGIQTPSGAIEEDQTPVEAAKEELEEETGLIANTWTNLGYVDALTMIIKSPAHLFLARDLVQGKKTENEIEVLKMPFDEAYQMVLDSKITHGPSCVAILKTKMQLQ